MSVIFCLGRSGSFANKPTFAQEPAAAGRLGRVTAQRAKPGISFSKFKSQVTSCKPATQQVKLAALGSPPTCKRTTVIQTSQAGDEKMPIEETHAEQLEQESSPQAEDLGNPRWKSLPHQDHPLAGVQLVIGFSTRPSNPAPGVWPNSGRPCAEAVPRARRVGGAQDVG